MANLNLDLDYFDHPKTIRLIGLLGKGSDSIPIRLWCFLGKYHARDGMLLGYSPEAIEQTLRWRGEPGKAIEALIAVGFLHQVENGYKAHDWREHQGHIWALKKRNKKVSNNRWKKIGKLQSTVDTSGTPGSNPGVPHTIHTIPTDQPAIKKQKKPQEPPGKDVEIPPDLLESEPEIRDWLEYKAERREVYKPLGINALWRTLRLIPPERRRAAIDRSIAAGWRGIFDEKGGLNGNGYKPDPAVVGAAAPVPGKYANRGQVIGQRAIAP